MYKLYIEIPIWLLTPVHKVKNKNDTRSCARDRMTLVFLQL